MVKLALVAAVMGISGAGVAYAQTTCPTICYVNCGDDVWCQMMQWMYQCDRRVCEG